MTEELESGLEDAWFRLSAKYPALTKLYCTPYKDRMLVGISKSGSFTQAFLPLSGFDDKASVFDTLEQFYTRYCI